MHIRRRASPTRARDGFPPPFPPGHGPPRARGYRARRKESAASLEDVPNPFPTAFTSLAPFGAAPGPDQPRQVRGDQPRTSTSRSRMPLIGLVRLQRALRAAMPCSTQSWRDPMRGCRPGPCLEAMPPNHPFILSIESKGVWGLPQMGSGDSPIRYRVRATRTRDLWRHRQTLPGGRGGTQSVRGAASNGRTSAAHVGVTAFGETRASPRGEIRIGWYCRAPAGQIDE